MLSNYKKIINKHSFLIAIKKPDRYYYQSGFKKSLNIIFSSVPKLFSSLLNPIKRQHNRHDGFDNRDNRHVPKHQML